MGNHKNHGNRQPTIPGFRPGKAPALIQTNKPITYTMGLDADLKYVVIEFNQPIANLQMPPEHVDEIIQNLQGAKAKLLELRAAKA